MFVRVDVEVLARKVFRRAIKWYKDWGFGKEKFEGRFRKIKEYIKKIRIIIYLKENSNSKI
jgi:glutaredoxin-related protein